MSNESKVREQFEAWCRRDMAAKSGCFERNRLGEYVYYKQTGLAWAAWQASRAAALEEAEELCRREARDHGSGCDEHRACIGCADAIRALAGRGV